MSRKQQLVELLAVRGVATKEQLEAKTVDELEQTLDQSNLDNIRAQARQQVHESTARELQEALDQRNLARSEARLQQIFRTVIVDGKTLVYCESNRQALLDLLDGAPLDNLSAQWLVKRVKENPSRFAWQDVVNPAKRRQADAVQAKQDRETFSAVARELGLADSDANFSIVSQQLGPGLPDIRASITTMVGDNGPGIYLFDADGNTFQLTPATQEQIAQWAYERAKTRELWLKTEASPDELRAAVRAEGASRAANQQQQFQQQQIEAEKLRQAGQFPPLPEMYLGQKLDSRFIKRASTEVFKQLIRRFGSAQVTEALNTRI